MNKLYKGVYALIILFTVLLLSSCNYLEEVVSYENPRDPPDLPFILDKDRYTEETRNKIDMYQTSLLAYIDYLEMYYTSVGTYFNTSNLTPLPKGYREECKMKSEFFKELPLLPAKHVTDNMTEAEIISNLADTLNAYRQEMFKYNERQRKLKEEYQNCF